MVDWFGFTFTGPKSEDRIGLGPVVEWGVYLLYDARGRLLYVGKSFEPGGRAARLRAHRRKWWGPWIRRWEWHPVDPNTEVEAMRVEAEWIGGSAPIMNTVLNGGRGRRIAELVGLS